MKRNDSQDGKKIRFFEDRAVMAGAIAVTVFLCLFTVFELFVIKMEWNLPIMNVFIGGADNYIFSQYREEEEKLEQSIENVVAKEETVGTEADVCDKNTENVEETEQGEAIWSTEHEIDTESAVSSENATSTESENPLEPEEDEFPYYIKINRQENVVTIYEKNENGEYENPVKAILCSTGLYDATPKGVFQLSSKYVWRLLNGGVYGQYASRITGGVLFHSVPYASKNKATLYTDKYNKLGQQASMGCVRLTVEDAKWIYENCPSGTTVEIYDSEDPGPLGKPESVKIDKDSPNKGWDPTDPDERNPWHAWSKDE